MVNSDITSNIGLLAEKLRSSSSANKDLVDTGIYLSAGVTKVRVYYWVEGQDVDTENNASGSSMKLGLEFTIE